MDSTTRAPRSLRKIRRASRQTQQDAQRTVQRAVIRWGQNPLILGIVGVLLLGAWLGCSLFQVETTEAWILQAQPPGIANVSWGVVLQAGLLITGNLSGAVGKAIVVGWVVELLTIVFGVCLEVAAHGVGRSSDILRAIFILGGFALLIFNGYTDYAYGSLPSGTCGQAFFAGVMAFIVVFGLPAGLELLIRAKDEYNRP